MIKFIVKSFTPREKGKFIGEAEGELHMEILIDDKNVQPLKMPIKKIGCFRDSPESDVRCVSDAKGHKDLEGKWVKDYHYNDFTTLNHTVWKTIAQAISDHIKQKQTDF